MHNTLSLYSPYRAKFKLWTWAYSICFNVNCNFLFRRNQTKAQHNRMIRLQCHLNISWCPETMWPSELLVPTPLVELEQCLNGQRFAAMRRSCVQFWRSSTWPRGLGGVTARWFPTQETVDGFFSQAPHGPAARPCYYRVETNESSRALESSPGPHFLESEPQTPPLSDAIVNYGGGGWL